MAGSSRFDFALITLTFSISAVIASYLADRIGVREAIQIVGGLALGWSVVWWFLTKRVRHRPAVRRRRRTRPEPVPEPGPEPV